MGPGNEGPVSLSRSIAVLARPCCGVDTESLSMCSGERLENKVMNEYALQCPVEGCKIVCDMLDFNYSEMGRLT